MPATPAAVAAYVGRWPAEVLALFDAAIAAENARRIREARAVAASSEGAARLAERMTAAEYAEEVGCDRTAVGRWARAKKVRGWDGRKAPRGSWIEADPRGGVRREREDGDGA